MFEMPAQLINNNLLNAQSKSTLENMDKFKGYRDIVKVLDKANAALISPKKIAYIGGFALDLESTLTETLSMNISDKTVEVESGTFENAVENLASVKLTGIIADNSFTEAKNAFDMAGDIVGNLGERLQMASGFFLKDAHQKQIKSIQNGIAKAQGAMNSFSQKYEFAKGILTGKNEMISGGSSISRSQERIAWLKAIYSSKKVFEFACEFAYYPHMMITDLTINRNDANKDGSVSSGCFKVNMTLQEIRTNERGATDSDSNRNGRQALKAEFGGEVRIAGMSLSELNRSI